MESGLSQANDAIKECKKDDYMTHPAFLSIPSNGFWVGKFETGYNQNSDVQLPITDTSKWTKEFIDDSKNMDKTLPQNIIVKPNVYSWRNSNVYNYFMSAFNFNRNLDSHMMKNTEWGAVAYLSYSKYGIGTEIRINNNSNFSTGYAANEKDAESSNTNNTKWNTKNGYTASTTGNISGVYDMSGGAYEYMASYKEDSNLSNSGGMDTIISNLIYDKYLDKYSSSSTITSYKYRILGDATGELGPFWHNNVYHQNSWNKDDGAFIQNSDCWFLRSGSNAGATKAGQFAFARYTGSGYSYETTRLILTPTK